MKPTCLICGCTEGYACPGGCGWINKEKTICGACCGDKMEFVDLVLLFQLVDKEKVEICELVLCFREQ